MAIVWAVTGAQFTADSARAETFKSTSGARGVTLPEDMKVSAQPTPGASVRVGPGGATLPAGYPAAPGQSYGTYQSTTVTVPVTATGSGGAVTKYLIQRVTDPQFEGNAPANPITASYDSFVWVSTLTGLNYPYVPLAKLVQPASTATITNAMLTDIRQVANPRTERVQFLLNSTNPQNKVTAALTVWPVVPLAVDVPAWCTFAQITVTVGSAQLLDGQFVGTFRVTFDGRDGWATLIDINKSGAAISDPQRTQAFFAHWSATIPSNIRGTTQNITLRTEKLGGEGYIRADQYTQIVADVTFMEVPA